MIIISDDAANTVISFKGFFTSMNNSVYHISKFAFAFSTTVNASSQQDKVIFKGETVERNFFITNYDWSGPESMKKAAEVQKFARDGLHDTICVWESDNVEEVIESVKSVSVNLL